MGAIKEVRRTFAGITSWCEKGKRPGFSANYLVTDFDTEKRVYVERIVTQTVYLDDLPTLEAATLITIHEAAQQRLRGIVNKHAPPEIAP